METNAIRKESSHVILLIFLFFTVNKTNDIIFFELQQVSHSFYELSHFLGNA